MLTHKRCFRCGLVLPLSRFWRKARSPDGYQASCILCRKNNIEPEHIRLARQQVKRCRICEQIKPFDEFHNHAGHNDGKANECRDCRQHMRNSDKWKERHTLRAQGKKRCVICHKIKQFCDFYKAPSSSSHSADGHVAICKLCWNRRRREDYRSRKRKYKQWARQWCYNNPHKRKAIATSYYARKKQADGEFGDHDIEILFNCQSGLCVYHLINPDCLVDLSIGYHIDHITPLSRKGTNYPNNLQLLCAHCNTSKGNKTDKEFREWLHSL